MDKTIDVMVNGTVVPMTLGQIIGTIDWSFDKTLANGDVVKGITVHFDCKSSSNEEITSWIARNRTIALQVPVNLMTKAEVETNVKGKTFNASSCGQKIKTRAEQIKTVMAATGLNEAAAALIVDNPEAVNEMMTKDKKAE